MSCCDCSGMFPNGLRNMFEAELYEFTDGVGAAE
jgi:hypothetical protein